MMGKYASPTLKDIFAPTEERVVADTPEKLRYASPTLPDMGLEENIRKQNHDWGGATLQVGPFDTGLPISPNTNQFLSGMGHSFAQTGRAAKQITGNMTKQEALDLAKTDQPLMDTGMGMAGDIAGSVAQTAPLPVGTLAKGAGAMAKAAGAKRLAPIIAGSLATDAALTGAGMSQMRPMLPDETRLGQMGWGAGAGAVGHAVMKPVSSAIGKIINTVRNKWGDPAAQKLDKLAREYGVDLSAGDATNSTAYQTFENTIKDIPGSGRKAAMERQAGQVQDMLYSLREDMRPDLTIPNHPAGMSYSSPEEMMVGEINRNYKNLIKQKDDLFANVDNVIAQNPSASKVDLDKTHTAIKSMLSDYPEIFKNFKDVDSSLVDKLTGLSGDLGNLGRNQTTGKFAPKANYNEAQWLRKRLGALSAQADRQTKSGSVGAITDDAAGQLKQVYKAVNQDLDSWGANPNNTAVHEAYKTAQDFYKDNVLPFKRDPTLSKVVSEFKPFDSDLAAKTFFKEGMGNTARKVMKFQTPEGQAASQFVLVDDFIKKALDTEKESGVDISKYLKRSRQLDIPAREVFSPDVQKHMDNVEEILRAAHRSEDFMNGNTNVGRNMAMTGARAIPWLAGAGAAGAATIGGLGIAPAAVGLGGLWGLTKAINSMGSNQVGKRALLSSPKLPGSLQDISELISTRAGAPTFYDKLHSSAGFSDVPEMFSDKPVDPIPQ